MLRPELNKGTLRGYADALLVKWGVHPKLTFADALPKFGDAKYPTAKKVEDKLYDSPLSDLLVPRGTSLAMDPPDDYYPDFGLEVSDETFAGCSLRVWGNGWDFNDGSWLRQFEINLFYRRGSVSATQVISHSVKNGSLSLRKLSSSVHSIIYAESGYEGHRRLSRDISHEELEFFYDLFFDLADRTAVKKRA